MAQYNFATFGLLFICVVNRSIVALMEVCLGQLHKHIAFAHTYVDIRQVAFLITIAIKAHVSTAQGNWTSLKRVKPHSGTSLDDTSRMSCQHRREPNAVYCQHSLQLSAIGMVASIERKERLKAHDDRKLSMSDVNSVILCNGIYWVMLNEGRPAISGMTFIA